MAIRFIAFLPHPRSQGLPRPITLSTPFKVVEVGPDWCLWIAGDHVVLPQNQGAIIGHIFTKGVRPSHLTGLDTDMMRRTIETQGRSLMMDLWGGYVAILSNAQTETYQVIRDPSGAMPCYHFSIKEGLIITSDVETLESAGFLKPLVDWHGLAIHLTGVDLRGARTSLQGVSELLAGERLSFHSGRSYTAAIWSPWEYMEGDDRSQQEMADILRAGVDACTGAWANCFERIGLSLSGGLDSSIVAAGLRNHAGKVIALTMATDEAEGDERRYARHVADAFHLPIIEAPYRFDTVDVLRSSSRHLPRPTLSAIAQAEMAIKQDIERSDHLNAFFAGHGGDNVFCNMQSATPIVDRFLIEGLSPGVLETFNDICALTGCSTWEALAHASRKLLPYNRRYRWRRETDFLDPVVATKHDSRMRHPWLQPPPGTPPGKAVHVAMLLRIQGTLDGFSRTGAVQINPLLSQPIVEACLGIPTWRWFVNGRNRSVARLAYDAVLPRAILDRRSKGGPESFAYRLIEDNRNVLKEHLLGGTLADHGLLDLAALRRVFVNAAPIASSHYFRLSFLAEAEAWARHWAR